MFMLLLASNIKYLRKQKKVTQQDIGDAVGVSYNAVSNYENGKFFPTAEVLVKICEFFGVSSDDLLLRDLSTGEQAKPFEPATLPQSIQGKNLLIPAGAQSGYLQEWTADYVRSLSMVAIPGVEGEARTFEIVENTMIPDLAPGEYVACTACSLGEIQSGRVYVIVSDQIQISYAQVEKDRVLCIPENKEEYKPYYVPVAKIREVWEAKMKISPKVTDPLAGGYHPSRLRNLEEFLKGKFPDMIAE